MTVPEPPSEETLRRFRNQLFRNGIKSVADVRRLLETWPTVTERLNRHAEHPHRGLGEQARGLFARALEEGTTAEWFDLQAEDAAPIELPSAQPIQQAVDLTRLVQPLQAVLGFVQGLQSLAAERAELQRVLAECRVLRDELRQQQKSDLSGELPGAWLQSQTDNLHAEIADLNDSVEQRLERFDAKLLQVRGRLDRLEYAQVPVGAAPPVAKHQLVVDGEVVD